MCRMKRVFALIMLAFLLAAGPASAAQAAFDLSQLTLEQLQARAQGASGQMQALGYANQLASQQANQLLQIRALLIAQQNAVTTRMQAEADKEAVQQAASEQLRSGTFQASPSRTW